MTRNCFEDEAGVKGRQKADHDARGNGLYRGRMTLVAHVVDGRMKAEGRWGRLAVAVVDAVDESRSRRMGCAVLPLSGPLQPLLQSQLSLSLPSISHRLHR